MPPGATEPVAGIMTLATLADWTALQWPISTVQYLSLLAIWTGAIVIHSCSLTITELSRDEPTKDMVIGIAASKLILAVAPRLEAGAKIRRFQLPSGARMAPTLTNNAMLPADLRHAQAMTSQACRYNVGRTLSHLVDLLRKVRDNKFEGANSRLGRATTITRWPMKFGGPRLGLGWVARTGEVASKSGWWPGTGISVAHWRTTLSASRGSGT